jgi:hypothetical protein
MTITVPFLKSKIILNRNTGRSQAVQQFKKGTTKVALFIIHTIDLISGYGSVYPTNYNNQ